MFWGGGGGGLCVVGSSGRKRRVRRRRPRLDTSAESGANGGAGHVCPVAAAARQPRGGGLGGRTRPVSGFRKPARFGGGGGRDARFAQIFGTGGLISADRRTKPTLMLTIPRSSLSRLQRIFLSQRSKLWSLMMLAAGVNASDYRYSRNIGRVNRRISAWILT